MMTKRLKIMTFLKNDDKKTDVPVCTYKRFLMYICECYKSVEKSRIIELSCLLTWFICDMEAEENRVDRTN